MVRLRSDRWYSRSGQRRVRLQQRPVGGGIRRVFSLAVLLILVVWVMQRSAEPEAYERIFRYLGVPLDSSGAGDQSARAFRGTGGASIQAVPTRTSASSVEEFEKATSQEGPKSDTSSPEVDTPSVNLPQVAQSMAAQWNALTWSSTDLHNACQLTFGAKATEASSSDTRRDAVDEAMSEMKWSRPDIELAVQIGLTEQQAEFTHWLDQKLLTQLTDGSPWRSSETDVFYRLLQRANQWERTNADQLSVMSYPALKESIALQRGQKWVRFRGWIEQAKVMSIKDSHWGFESYWTLWIRPSDQTARPVVAYVTRLPVELAGKPDAELRGEIEVFGLPAKTMAYNAIGGIEVAPTLCGIAGDYFEKESSSETVKAEAGGSQFDWIWPVILAGAFAATWVAWIWKSSKTVVIEDEETQKSNSRKLKFVLGAAKKAERDGTNVGTLLLAIILGHSLSANVLAYSECVIAQAEAPVEELDEDKAKAVQLLSSRLTDEVLFEVRLYASNEPTGLNQFPNSLGRLMYTLAQLGSERLQPLASLAEPTLKWKIRDWQGWVNKCDVVALSPQQAEWMGQKQVYRLQVEMSDSQDGTVKSVLFLSQAPSQWLNQAELHQPFRATVIDLTDHELGQKDTGTSDAENKPSGSLFGNIGVAHSVRWVVQDATDLKQMRPTIFQDWQRLALLGSDLTWIDLARSRQRLDLAVEDRNSFYQLLKIAAQFEASEASNPVGANFWNRIQGPELLATREQDKWVGRAVEVTGRIVRITRVPIENPVSQELSGSGFYYEMDGFIRIEGRRIVIPPANKGSNSEASGARTEDLVYENEFPMTVVALNLPDFLKEGEYDSQGVQHQSWTMQRWVDVKGVFFRNWSYRSEYVSRGKSRERQMAPLIIAANIQIADVTFEPLTSPGNWLNWLAMFMIFGLLALIWGFVVADSKKKAANRYKKNSTP